MPVDDTPTKNSRHVVTRIDEARRKLDWAEDHLLKIETLIEEFVGARLYTATQTIEGKQKRPTWRMHFTSAPDQRIALRIGDFLYNVRAALDYLTAGLVPSSERSHVMFPCIYEAVWSIPFQEGENQKRTDDRLKWDVTTQKMKPEAVAILKELQPVDEAANFPNFHILGMLNRLSNKDRHRQLNVIAWGLGGPVLVYGYRADGSLAFDSRRHITNLTPDTGLEDGARLHLPNDVVTVELNGTPVVVIRGGAGDRHVRVPERLHNILDFARTRALDSLAPYAKG